MGWKFFVLAACCFVGQSLAWFLGCDYSVPLTIGVQQSITSQGFPKYGYNPNSSCRYIINAPGEYKVQAICDIDLVGTPGICKNERFYVGLDGKPDINYSYFYCGTQKKMNFTSNGNSLNLAYISTMYSGKFNCTITAVCDCGCGINSRIVGGVDATPGEFPPMASLYNIDEERSFCGATIISSRWALSAAHCVKLNVAADIQIIAGLYEQDVKSNYTVFYNVSQVVFHPKYVAKDDIYDIGLVQSKTIFQWSKAVSPACLPFLYDKYDFANRVVTATGWGTLWFGGPIATILQKVDLTVITNAACAKAYNGTTILPSHLCTTAMGHDACQWDSGGPLWYRGAVDKRLFNVGTISFGDGCGGVKPGVNTRTTEFLPWIETFTGTLCRRQIT